MSYATYLRNKLDAQPKIIDLHKPSDASQHTHKKRLESNQVFFADGTGKGSLAMDTSRPHGTPLLQHASTSFTKASGRSADASDYTSFRGHIGVGDDSKYLNGGRITVEGCCNSGVIPDLPSTFIARGMTIAGDGLNTRVIVVGIDTTGSGNTIYKSADNGVTWTSIVGGFQDAGYGVAVDPTSTDRVVAVGKFTDASHTSILYSTDAGDTWASKTVGGYFAVEGHGVACMPTAGYWVMTGNDGGSGNNIKYFGDWAAVTGSTATADINELDNGESLSNWVGWGVSMVYVGTGGADSNIVIVGQGNTGSTLNNTILYAETNDPTKWYGGVTGRFTVAGYGVAGDSGGRYIMTGQDGGLTNIKYFDYTDFTTCSNVPTNTFTVKGTSVRTDNTSWTLTGDGSTTLKIADSFSDAIAGTFSSQVSVLEPAFCSIVSDVNTIVGGRNISPVQYSISGGSFVASTGLPTGIPGSNGKKPAKYASGSDFIRAKGCALTCVQPHNADELGKPLFVDNTIRLSAMHAELVGEGCGENSLVRANHTASEGIHPPSHPSRAVNEHTFMAAPPGFQNKGVGGARIGAYYNPRSGYVENKHGNDLGVNPRRVPVPFVISSNAPAHLKINNPKFGNVKP